ncbi:MAG: transglycosylase SLT domain-containing protein, partial [Bdellovibrionota bacterium]
DRYGGNWVMGLAAYNAGPGALERWKKAANGSWGMLEFIESIGYRETRDYVSSILRNYYWYTFLLKGEDFNGLIKFWNGNSIETEVDQSVKRQNGSA